MMMMMMMTMTMMMIVVMMRMMMMIREDALSFMKLMNPVCHRMKVVML
jgi:hypothetical protein